VSARGIAAALHIHSAVFKPAVPERPCHPVVVWWETRGDDQPDDGENLGSPSGRSPRCSPAADFGRGGKLQSGPPSWWYCSSIFPSSLIRFVLRFYQKAFLGSYSVRRCRSDGQGRRPRLPSTTSRRRGRRARIIIHALHDAAPCYPYHLHHVLLLDSMAPSLVPLVPLSSKKSSTR
jgi:hypothetical protein